MAVVLSEDSVILQETGRFNTINGVKLVNFNLFNSTELRAEKRKNELLEILRNDNESLTTITVPSFEKELNNCIDSDEFMLIILKHLKTLKNKDNEEFRVAFFKKINAWAEKSSSMNLFLSQLLASTLKAPEITQTDLNAKIIEGRKNFLELINDQVIPSEIAPTLYGIKNSIAPPDRSIKTFLEENLIPAYKEIQSKIKKTNPLLAFFSGKTREEVVMKNLFNRKDRLADEPVFTIPQLITIANNEKLRKALTRKSWLGFGSSIIDNIYSSDINFNNIDRETINKILSSDYNERTSAVTELRDQFLKTLQNSPSSNDGNEQAILIALNPPATPDNSLAGSNFPSPEAPSLPGSNNSSPEPDSLPGSNNSSPEADSLPGSNNSSPEAHSLANSLSTGSLSVWSLTNSHTPGSTGSPRKLSPFSIFKEISDDGTRSGLPDAKRSLFEDFENCVR